MRVERNNKDAAYIVEQVLKVKLCAPFEGLCIMGEDDFPYGVVIFNDYTGENIEMTGVGRGCWSPKIIRDLARYVFCQLKVRRVTARTAVSNEKAIRALERMGFVREGLARQWFAGEDAILFGLLAEEQRLVKL